MPLRRPTGPRRLGPGERLPLAGHLDELRRRLIVSALALAVAFAGLYAIHDRLVRLMERPLPAGHQRLLTLSPTEPFTTVVGVTFAAAVLAAAPVWLYQLYAFVVPALARHTRRRTLAAVGALSCLFVAGVAFGYLVALPLTLRVLLGAGDGLFAVQLRAGEYFTFASMMLVAAGALFEVPVAMVVLARLGIVRADAFRRHRRVAIVAIAAISALLPGGDPFGMLALMVPQIALYEAGARVAALVERRPSWRPGRTAGAESAGRA